MQYTVVVCDRNTKYGIAIDARSRTFSPTFRRGALNIAHVYNARI